MERFICLNQVLGILFFFSFFVSIQVNCSSFLSSSSSSHPIKSTHYLCTPKQSLALLQFKSEMLATSKPKLICYGNSAPKMDSWKEGRDCCSWDGVTCNEVTGNVIGLDLACSWLQGTIKDNSSLFQLSHLQWLNLAYNKFYGSISPEFGQLTELTQLNLSYSAFYGLVPFQISRLSKITLLDLSTSDGLDNDLSIDQQTLYLLMLNLTRLSVLKLRFVDMSSVKPYSLLNLSFSMMVIDLGFTKIQGKFPEEVFQHPNVQEVYLLANENLTGYLPKSNWSSHLRVLDLTSSNFKGEIPNSIGNLQFLESVFVSDCNFIGLIPASIGNLTRLTELDMAGNNLIGELPSLSKLQKVTHINLSRNKLTGQISEIFDNFSQSQSPSHSSQLYYHVNVLYKLDLSKNLLNGMVPSWFFTRPSLEYINLSSNKFTGPIEKFDIDLANSLRKVCLQNNEIHGKIPSWLLGLPSLEYIDLSSNKLTGPIEKFNISLSNSLQGVYLQNNEIHDSIPSFIFEFVNLISLDISSNNLSGTVKFDMLSKLKDLGQLDLSNNSQLTFSFSSNMNYSLPSLGYLNFSFCSASEFPMFLRTSEQLKTLDLSNNRIYGRILKTGSEGWKSLSFLDLSNNFLTYIEHHPWKNIRVLLLRNNTIQGSILVPPLSTQVFLFSTNKLSGQIPPSICMLSSLRYLSLSENNLCGIIPPCLGNFGNGLVMLHLQKNNLEGGIPDIFTNGRQLASLDLSSNKLEGPLPRSLANCSKLEVVNVGNNMISDIFPCWLGTLSKLKIINLRSNRFYGSICDSKAISPFENLQIIDLSHNEFTGFLSRRFFESMKKMIVANKEKSRNRCMGGTYYFDSVNVTMKGGEYTLDRIFHIFTSIDLSRNQFQGGIPEVLGTFKSLMVLNLSYNNLTGNIPIYLANLTALESLDLSFNKLDGRIPNQLVSVTTLSRLNLSYNRLSGVIPQGNQFSTFENDSFIGNKGLCGNPLSVKCGDDGETTQPPPSSVSKEEDGTASRFEWKFAMTGYVSGVVIGISMGYIVFSTGKPQWFVRMVEERLIKEVIRSNKRGGISLWYCFR